MVDFKAVFLVGLGSFVGGSLRYIAVIFIDSKTHTAFPLSVFLVNAVGSFLIGLLAPIFVAQGLSREAAWPLFISVGALGGFTTFSTFSLQTLKLMQSGSIGMAALNALVSVACCLIAVYIGYKIGGRVV